jgi:hypothetical protein
VSIILFSGGEEVDLGHHRGSTKRKSLAVGKSVGMTATLTVYSPDALGTSPFGFPALALLPALVVSSVVLRWRGVTL